MARNWGRTITFILAVVVSLSGCGRPSLSSDEVRLSAQLKSTFAISLPCSLVWCSPYLGNSGGVGGLIVDVRGDSLKWAMGRNEPSARIPAAIEGDSARIEAWEDSTSKNPPSLAYVGADQFQKSGARPLSVRSKAESLFIQLLWYVAGPDTVLTRDQTSTKRFLASNVARALERQRAGLPPFRNWGEPSAAERSAMDSASRAGNTSAIAAVAWIQDYYHDINEHRYREAYAHWEQNGQASNKAFAQFEKGFDETERVEVTVSEPGSVGAAAGSRYIVVPVRLVSYKRDGSKETFLGTYTLRLSVVDGATPEQRTWHIYSANIRKM